MSPLVQVFGPPGLRPDHGLRRPAAEKAPRHESRGKLGTGGATGAMGILMVAPISMLDVTPTGCGRGNLHAGAIGSVE